MSSNSSLSYEDFARVALEQPAQRQQLRRQGALHHVLCTAQFELSEIESLLQTARAIRALASDASGAEFLRGTLAGKRVMHWFGQPSTRTAQSFIAAAHCLGAQTELLTDLQNSSMAKGETVQDSVRVMAELFDALVIRHAQPEFSLRAVWGLMRGRRSIPVISAGMGPTEHVTQSLLDLLTLSDAWSDASSDGGAQVSGVSGKRVVIVGDILRNRAARSLAFGLAICGVHAIDWVCPPQFAPDPELREFLSERGVLTQEHVSLADCLKSQGQAADAIYMTRLQQEWDQKGEGKKTLGTGEGFVLTPELGECLRKDCWILHPLPRVNELPEAWDEDPRLLIWEQVKNGLWARASVLATVMGVRDSILSRA